METVMSNEAVAVLSPASVYEFIFANSKEYPLELTVKVKWQNFLDYTVAVC
jgi:hypothetical protein